jgi:SAM-dependent methyltransferase
MIEDIRRYWDLDARTYDRAPGHRHRSAAERSAWASALCRLLPPAPSRVLDVGAGTGFLSLTAARLGHRVVAVDLSSEMLGRLRETALSEGLAVEVVQAPAEEVPSGFDAVMERHLLWTLPDPEVALRAWRAAAPGGRLLLVESLWGVEALERLKARARERLRRVLGRPPDHHGSYPEALREGLPLASGTSPSTLVEMARRAGWGEPRLERLRDVEWAALLELNPLERLLGIAPRFVVSAG